MEYALRDAAFPGVRVRLTVLPLADSVGLVMKLRVEGAFAAGRNGVGLRRRLRLYHELRSRCPAVPVLARAVRRQRDPLGKRAVHAPAKAERPSCGAAAPGRKASASAIRKRLWTRPPRFARRPNGAPRRRRRKSPSGLPCRKSGSARSPRKAGSSSAAAARSSRSWPIRARRRSSPGREIARSPSGSRSTRRTPT